MLVSLTSELPPCKQNILTIQPLKLTLTINLVLV